jgi:uncharacterized protein
MIIYSGTKKEFVADVVANKIEKTILSSFVREMGHSTGRAEVSSWRNSMLYMNNVISDPDIPDDAGIAIEYKIPQTSKRIDFILTGTSEQKKKTAILVELKQWSEADISDLDGVVKTFVGGSKREVSHPSYQVWSYAALLEDYNEGVYGGGVSLIPCAYLHNYEPDNVITNDFYKEYLDKAPVFLRPDSLKLRDFIKRFVKHGDNGDLLYIIEHGKIRPSKALADNLASMLDGNKEFALIDDQKIVYERALALAEKSFTTGGKNVLIVEGGPGTGKSVVAINLLSELIKRGHLTQYVTKNSAPREVYQMRLSGRMTRTRISNLFSSSGSFYNLNKNTFDSLIVDEAHRLNAKSGLFGHLGENQIKEIIEVAKFSIFFLDEDQRVTLKDIGKKSEIIKWGEQSGAQVFHLTLESQFRCNGSDGYLAWIDDVLQIRETANDSLEGLDFDFEVVDNPSKIHKEIIEKNSLSNKARMLAGYCWNWISRNRSDSNDIVIGDYAARWNLRSHGQAFIIHPDSVTEVGCIHTSQGLELDHVGVIIGPDLVVREGKVVTDARKRATTDKSLSGYQKLLKKNPEEARVLADSIIKNTYRTLLTRGMKSCRVYCVDLETQEYFRSRLEKKSVQYFSYTNIPDGSSFNLDAK